MLFDEFQHYDVIIYDVSEEFGILFSVWNSVVMSCPCAKCHCDMTINNGITCTFHVFCFVYFWTNDSGLSIMTSLILYKFFFVFELTRWWSIPVQNFIVIGSLTMKTQERADPPPPPQKKSLNMSKKPSPIRVKLIFQGLSMRSVFSKMLENIVDNASVQSQNSPPPPREFFWRRQKPCPRAKYFCKSTASGQQKSTYPRGIFQKI